MQRLRDKKEVMVAMAIGLVLLGGTSYAAAAEEAKKPAEQATPPAASKAPAAKKAPEKKASAKSGTQKTKPSAAVKPTGPAPTYASAETAANAQACFGEAPKIESVMPDEGKPGDKVTISGRNFGPAECLRSLSFGPGYPATFKLDHPTQITATVPKGRRTGLAMMTVTTASGEDSKVFAVK